MSKLKRLHLRMARPRSLFGLVGLQTGAEIISLALVFNKVTGVYGLLAILTGFQLSLLQLSTYLYSIAVLILLIILIPHIRRQSPFECLALAWLYAVDTIINGAYTAAFGLSWYFASTTTSAGVERSSATLPRLMVEALRRDGVAQTMAMPRETMTSMLLIVGLTLIRVYFSMVVMAFARQVLQRSLQPTNPEGAGVEENDGPFAEQLPDGGGRKGRIGRLMISVGRRYWLDATEIDNWEDSVRGKQNGGGALVGEV